ncbi:hypothetical protein ACPWUF_08915 [Bisgaard Taxon 46]
MNVKTFIKITSTSLFFTSLVACESNDNTYGGKIISDSHNKLLFQEFTHQPLENAKYLKVGMTENEVIQIMGEPVTREFQDRRSALQWCSTGMIGTNNPYDRFLLAAFTDERLTEIKNFSNKDEFEIISAQVEKQGSIDCSSLIQNVHWLEPADKVIEIRERNMNQYY